MIHDLYEEAKNDRKKHYNVSLIKCSTVKKTFVLFILLVLPENHMDEGLT